MLTLFFFMGFLTAADESSVCKDDLCFLRRVVRQEAEEVIPWDTLPPVLAVVEEGEGSDCSWVALETLREMLVARGKRVYSSPKSSLPALYLRAAGIGVSYSVPRPLLGPPRSFGRRARGTVHLRMEDAAGNIMWVRDLQLNAEEKLPWTDREDVRVEGISPPLAPGSPYLGRTLLLTAVVGILVYLLYTGGQ